MGCGAVSKPVASVSSPAPRNSLNKINNNNSSKSSASSPTPVVKKFKHIVNDLCPMIRTDHPTAPKVLEITGEAFNYNLQYVYVSQRGYYPNALGKANQDSYTICESLLDDTSCNFFGIFDGHGEYGDYCSHYSADNLPGHLVSEIEKNGGTDAALRGNKAKDTYVRSFLNTNFGLHSSKVDDTLSGTTGISILQKGDKLFVANVGDSRAIIASDVDGKLVYSPLSSDQTPYRKDERERLKKAGARIMTMDQIEGKEPIHENFGTNLGEEIDQVGDPPRVWDATLEKPGCAFSRSIGDSVAKDVGVTAEPEILVWDLSPKDRFAVIASDGVFEFITSQAVVDMIEKFSDKLAAAKHVVAEAYRLWLTYDDRTDDISIIILSFENMVLNPNANPDAGQRSQQQQQQFMIQESKPVRKVLSKAKRKDIAENWSKDDVVSIDFDKIEDNKTEEEIARISNMLASNFMFENLSPIQKGQIYRVMKLRNVQAGEQIIREGDQGDEMYVIDKGQFNVLKKDENGFEQQVFTYTDEGAAFGELSLMYGKPRAASVIAKTNGRLYSIGRAAFRAVMMNKSGGAKKSFSSGLLEIYRSVPVLNELRLTDIQRLCAASKEITFAKGDIIASEDNMSSVQWALCVVITGVIRLIPKDESKKRQLRAELSFLSIEEIGSRFKEASADGKVKLCCIPKASFVEIIGDKDAYVKDTFLKKKSKGKRLQLDKLAIDDDANYQLVSTGYALSVQTLDHAVSFVGDVGYIGNFVNSTLKTVLSCKVYSKRRVLDAKLDSKILNDRKYLAVMSNLCHKPGVNNYATGIAQLACTLQDDSWAYLCFADKFDCDLSQALHSSAIRDEAKPYFIASALLAMQKVHDAGLIHRLINCNSFCISQGGCLKLTDFRFARPMDGSYCFTICGDPLYFAPELVTQQGYDFGADIWAFGVMMYEFHELASPFGTSETDETTIFRAISAFRPSKLVFTDRTPESARSLISNVLHFTAEDRCGYRNIADIKSSKYFQDLAWDKLDMHPGHPVDAQSAVELSSVFDDSANRRVTSDAFKFF